MQKKHLLSIFVIVAAVLGTMMWRKGSSTKAAQELHLYIWSNYMDPEVYQLFEKETGIKVVEEIFDSNEALENKLIAGVKGIDLIVPSDYAVSKFTRQGLLLELNKQNIPNIAKLKPEFSKPVYDAELKYVIPYLWGTTGIGYNKDKVTTPPNSWAYLFDPEKLQNVKSRVSMLDDPRETMSAVLKYLGFSINTKNDAELEKAKNVLLAQKDFLARYDSETYKDFLVTADLYLAHGYSGDVLKQRRDHAQVDYVIPQEGAVIWADNLAIPKNVKNEETKVAAEKFINFLLTPEINAKIVNFVSYPSTLSGNDAFVKPEILNDPNIYPSKETFSRLEWMQDLGEDGIAKLEKIWTEVKSK